MTKTLGDIFDDFFHDETQQKTKQQIVRKIVGEKSKKIRKIVGEIRREIVGEIRREIPGNCPGNCRDIRCENRRTPTQSVVGHRGTNQRGRLGLDGVITNHPQTGLGGGMP